MKRNTRIYVRVTPEEKRSIQERAKTHDYSASDFVRECGLWGKVQPVLSINLQQWAKLAGLVSNLNQLTRHTNAGVIEPELAPTIRETREMVDAIRQDLIATKEGLQ